MARTTPMISLANPVSMLSQQFGRRFEARRRVDGLVYVDFGADNGAILIDLGEGGLGFKSIAPVSINLALPLKFKLSGDASSIEGYAEVAWVDESGKVGGLRFVSLSADACAQIREWTGAFATPRPRALRAASGRASNSAPTGANSVQQSSTPERTALEPTKREEVPAQISEALAPAESAQVAEPSREISDAPSADKLTGEQAPADPSALPDASLAPESSVHVLPAADSTETLALRVDSASSAAPSILATGASESASPHEPERGIADGVEDAFSQVANPSPETSDAPSAHELAGERAPTDPSALPGAWLVSESSVHVLAAEDSIETLALRVDSASSAAPSILATGASESASPHEPERGIADGVEDAFSQVANPSPETSDAPSAHELAGERAPTDPSALPDASLISESSVHVLAAEDSTETLALRVDSASTAAPSIFAISTPESASPRKPERKIDDGAKAAASADSTTSTSETPKTVRTKRNLSPRSSLEIEPRIQRVPASEAPVARMREVAFGFSTQAPTTPGWAKRVPAPDSRNSVSVQKGQRRPTPPKPESPLTPANHHDWSGRGLRDVSASAEWETLPAAPGDEFRSKWMLVPRPLKFWIGAATGVCLVLALFAGIPSVRMRGARSGGSSQASVLAFQVEVVDLSNRRWMLRSAGEAGGSVRPPEASSAARDESAKSSHLSDSHNYNNTVAAPQDKTSPVSSPHDSR